jgi:hypothetical protein
MIMSRPPLRVAVLLSLGSLAVACDGVLVGSAPARDAVAQEDKGTPPADAKPPAADAGKPLPDSKPPAADAGKPRPDSKPPAADAGKPPPDSKPPSPDGATPGTNVIPATFFGMHLMDQTKWPTVPVGALGKGTQVVWPYVEKTKGVFDWSNLDAWVNAAQSHGVTIFFSPEKTPPWAAKDQSTCAPTYAGSPVTGCTSMVSNLKDWDDYVTALLEP